MPFDLEIQELTQHLDIFFSNLDDLNSGEARLITFHNLIKQNRSSTRTTIFLYHTDSINIHNC